jgi:hypothetical protein
MSLRRHGLGFVQYVLVECECGSHNRHHSINRADVKASPGGDPSGTRNREGGRDCMIFVVDTHAV